MAAEVKVLVSDQHWTEIQERILFGIDDKKREVWFFETPDLSLKQQEIILRTRISRKSKKVESTAKWRRWVSPFPAVHDAWAQLPGFKAEIDATLNDSVTAWSVTEEDLGENVFLAVMAEEKSVLELFSKNQRLLVGSAWPLIPWDKLCKMGPTKSAKWVVSENISVERWTVGEDSVIEISKRGESKDIILREICEWLSSFGIDAEALEGGKTAWALEHLVHLGQDASNRPFEWTGRH
jgi:hypothetical protein